MTVPKGMRLGLFQTEKIGNAIEAFEGKEFIPELINLITGIPLHTVRTVVEQKTLQGILKKVGRNRYSKISLNRVFTNILSKGFVADIVWQVLKSATEPMNLSEIFRAVQQRTDRTLVRKSVKTALAYWKKNNHLKVCGPLGNYGYELELHARSQRPITSYNSTL